MKATLPLENMCMQMRYHTLIPAKLQSVNPKIDKGNGLTLDIGNYQKNIYNRLNKLQEQNFVKRLWNKENKLWNTTTVQHDNINTSMGWLNVVNKMLGDLPLIQAFCKTIQLAGYDHLVLLGMGGSSMTSLVFQKAFSGNKHLADPAIPGMKLTVLDTTEPETVKKIAKEINISKTLFVVSSKSGTTVEVMAFFNYFFDQTGKIKGDEAGDHFIAITDEGSPLVELAKRKKFRKTFINFPEIGGRYSALSYFGILPAALMGINVKELLERTLSMIHACGSDVPASQNPGVILGTVIAELALKGCDKLTYLLPPSLNTFGLWLEQLLAESTGKNGKGILPLNGYPLQENKTYKKDRVFLQLEITGSRIDLRSKKPEHYIPAEYPLINILIKDELDLGKEFFRWEIATATAGAILGINPFNQPNVQESKIYTDRLLKSMKQDGKLPEIQITLAENSINYYATEKGGNAKILLEKFLHQSQTGDYVSIQTYLPEEAEVKKHLLEMRQVLQKNLHVAVTSEFGPRYLHSTGQYNKGGPNTGIFIQLICSSTDDIQIPGCAYTFGSLKRAQAIGDREALIKNKRRVMLIDLGKDYNIGLHLLKQIIKNIRPNSAEHYESIKKLTDLNPVLFNKINRQQTTLSI